jgi:hypothetical protein
MSFWFGIISDELIGGICVFAFVEMASEEEAKRAVGKEVSL